MTIKIEIVRGGKAVEVLAFYVIGEFAYAAKDATAYRLTFEEKQFAENLALERIKKGKP